MRGAGPIKAATLSPALWRKTCSYSRMKTPFFAPAAERLRGAYGLSV